jgi:protoheme IX farnesyltransferase
VTAVLYLWQTPHFATLADIHSDDYKKVGFKTLKFSYGADKSKLFVLVWSFGYMTALLFIPFSDVYTSRTIALANIVAAIPAAVFIIAQSKKPVMRFGFLNMSAVLFFVLLISDRLISY